MKTVKIMSTIFAVVGLGLIAITVFMSLNTYNFIQKSKVTTGMVVDFVRQSSTDSDNRETYSYAPVVEFTTEDKQEIRFTSSVSSNPPSYDVDDSVSVMYNPASPHDAKINSFFELWFGSIIAGFLGLISSGVGFGLIISSILRSRTIKKLLESGQKIEVAIKQVALDESLKVNGRSPYKILCEYNDGGKILILKSDNIWFDPTEYLKDQKISVYMDPANHKKYYVDISFLPKLA